LHLSRAGEREGRKPASEACKTAEWPAKKKGTEELSEQLARVPDLTKALREAPPDVQRQVFQAFELQILYDNAERRIEISATVSEAVANAFEKKKALPKEGSLVLLKEIAGGPIRFSLRLSEDSRDQPEPLLRLTAVWPKKSTW
jgi:hypothetical protein